MESGPTLTLTLKDLMLFALRASWAVNDSDGERLLNWFAEDLEEKLDVKREDLKKIFDELEIPLWDPEEDHEESEEEDQRSVEEPCGHCSHQTASMPNDMTDEGRLCADCYWDLDKEFKYQRARRIR